MVPGNQRLDTGTNRPEQICQVDFRVRDVNNITIPGVNGNLF
jgi:hypothetical protein